MPALVERLGLGNGKRGKIPCPHPEHNESDPSAEMYDDHLYCYGCGRRWDSIDLIREVQGSDFWGALTWISRESGLPEPQRDPKAAELYDARREITRTYDEIFRDSLQNRDTAVSYLAGRGIAEDAIKDQAGYLTRNYEPPDRERAEKAGLFSRKGNFLFADSVIIPIRRAGETVSLYARKVNAGRGQSPHRYPKTTEPPMLPTLWGLDDVRTSEQLYVAESIIDAMSLRSHGYRSIAAFGTQGLNDSRLELLRKTKIRKVVLAFDSDSNQSGQKGALRAGERLFKAGFATEIVSLPIETGESKQDPNSFFQKHSAAAFERLQRREYLDARLGQIPRDARPEEQLTALMPVLELIASREELLWKPLVERVHKRFPGFDAKKLLKAVAQAAGREDSEHESREKFRPMLYVEQLRETPTIYHAHEFYRWSDAGYYEHVHRLEMDQEIVKIFGPDIQAFHLDGIRKFLITASYVRPEKVDIPGTLNIANGVLDLKNDTWTEGHTPQQLSTMRLNVEFDKKACAPQWQQFLAEVLPEDDKRALLQQWFGYILTADTSHHKALVLLGGGSNGKSVVLEVLRGLLGQANVSHLTLSDLKQRFRVAELNSKLVNITHEISSKELLEDGLFKSIVAGEPVLIEKKGRDPVTITPTARWIVATNKLPDTKDKSYGLMRRLCILPFSQTIPDAKQDRGLAKRIIEEELSGVLNWGLVGYQRLREEGVFIEPEASVQAKKKYEEKIRPELLFFQEHLRRGAATDKTTLKSIYEKYTDWCDEAGRKKRMTDATLRESIENYFGVEAKRHSNGVVIPRVLLL